MYKSLPGSSFLSLYNACYAGYIYFFSTYLFRLYLNLVCSVFLYLYLLIIPLSLFLKKMSSKGQNEH